MRGPTLENICCRVEGIEDDIAELTPDEGMNAPLFLQNITSFIGGTAADLDSIDPTNMTVPRLFQFMSADAGYVGLRTVLLRAGTDAENSPFIVRPDNYAGLTTKKIWELVI